MKKFWSCRITATTCSILFFYFVFYFYPRRILLCRNYLPKKDLEENSRAGFSVRQQPCKCLPQNKLAPNYSEDNRERLKNNAYKPPLPAVCMSFHRGCWRHIAGEKIFFYTWPEHICLKIISHSSPLHSSILFSC